MMQIERAIGQPAERVGQRTPHWKRCSVAEPGLRRRSRIGPEEPADIVGREGIQAEDAAVDQRSEYGQESERGNRATIDGQADVLHDHWLRE